MSTPSKLTLICVQNVINKAIYISYRDSILATGPRYVNSVQKHLMVQCMINFIIRVSKLILSEIYRLMRDLFHIGQGIIPRPPSARALMDQKQHTLPKHSSSPLVFSEDRVVHAVQLYALMLLFHVVISAAISAQKICSARLLSHLFCKGSCFIYVMCICLRILMSNAISISHDVRVA